jgi:hypothetical protein
VNPDLPDLLQNLPCGALIGRGIEDYRAGRHSVASCLALLASPRLYRAGLIDKQAMAENNTELMLYQLLCGEGGSAYSRYNSLLRELASFEHALDHRLSPTSS